MKKPNWVIEKEKSRRQEAQRTIWVFGIHAVRDALLNPKRDVQRLLLTKNAADRLEDALAACDIEPEIQDPRKFKAPLDPGSVHQGAAAAVRPLNWGGLDAVLSTDDDKPAILVLLDRVSDPHNVGAILRSAEVFGAKAVIATERHAAPETGALAKTASGALERQPYLRVRNLADTMEDLKRRGFLVLGLDATGDATLSQAVAQTPQGPIALVLGAEGPGLRDRTKATCDRLVRIDPAGAFGSLNVSNAAAVALYAVRRG